MAHLAQNDHVLGQAEEGDRVHDEGHEERCHKQLDLERSLLKRVSHQTK